jgi:3-deoxy-7-phosphoheptulonate synthase
MRVYFEKPRTTVGWKGLINDPRLDGSFRINEGLRLARRILLEINELELPAGTEYLDMITPQYIADLISWARSARARPRARSIASSRAGCRARSASRTAPTATCASRSTRSGGERAAPLPVGHQGRPLGDRAHRGQRGLPHHPAGARRPTTTRRASRRRKELAGAARAARDDRLLAREQPEEARPPGRRRADVGAQVAGGDDRIVGLMIESHLNPGGRRKPDAPLAYGGVDHRRASAGTRPSRRCDRSPTPRKRRVALADRA